MAKRKYDKFDSMELLVASGGRCDICNADVMSDWRTHKNIRTAEKAHIKSFSDIGPRADKSLSIEERNSCKNLIILCPTCHTTIDKKIAEGFYTVEWLLRKKSEKQQRIKTILDKLNDDECIFVKYSSVIGSQNSSFPDDSIYTTCFENGFFSKEGIINLSEDCNNEDIQQSIKSLDDKFNIRIQRLFDNNKEKTICLFARAPQPLLIYLGSKFNDKHKVRIFTSHRNLVWKYNDESQKISFLIAPPENKNHTNKVALTLCATASIQEERIKKALGDEVDVWTVKASEIGVDKINNQEELKQFYNSCVSVIDEIGSFYGKEIEINIFPAICNSLAITFGRAIFAKSHNKINIYDAIKKDHAVKDILRLSI